MKEKPNIDCEKYRQIAQMAKMGKDGQCGPQLELLMSKDVYRTQMVWPSRQTQGTCCRPFGAATAMDALGGTTPPVRGEDAALLIWRRRDCCQGMSLGGS